MMLLPLRIALRYIYARRSFHFITVITFISIIGITVGVAALISVLSIFNGFADITERQIVGFDPHLRIISAGKLNMDEVSDSLLSDILKNNEINAAGKVIHGRIVGVNGDNIHVFNIKAFDPDDSAFVKNLSRMVYYGKFDLKKRYGRPGIVLGIALADILHVLPGDTLTLLSPKMIEAQLRTFQSRKGLKCVVRGIFRSNFSDFDQNYGFVSSGIGKRLLSPVPRTSYSLDISLSSLEQTDNVKAQIRKKLPEGLEIKSWQDLNSDLFNIMKLERLGAFLILSLIIIIAVFNVLASLSMTVVEKRRDIAALKSFGATKKTIRNIFLSEGLIIGAISTVAGCILGLFLCYGQIEFSWFSVDSSKYFVSAIPVLVDYSDVIIICIFSFILSFLSTIYPAARASATIITESIREE